MVKDTNNKIGAVSIYDDGTEPVTTTTTAPNTTETTTTTTTAKSETTTSAETTTQIAVTTVVTEAPEDKYDLGDVNDDGNINAVDASRVLTAYALKATGQDMGLTEKQIEAADVNDDGKVDAVDASIILSFYAYKSTGGSDPFDVYLKKDKTM